MFNITIAKGLELRINKRNPQDHSNVQIESKTEFRHVTIYRNEILRTIAALKRAAKELGIEEEQKGE